MACCYWAILRHGPFAFCVRGQNSDVGDLESRQMADFYKGINNKYRQDLLQRSSNVQPGEDVAGGKRDTIVKANTSLPPASTIDTCYGLHIIHEIETYYPTLALL